MIHNRSLYVIMSLLTLVGVCCQSDFCNADWQITNNPADADKDRFYLGWTGSCWLATAANMLAGAGYGVGTTVQERGDRIYIQLIGHFGFGGGFTDTALKWWLKTYGGNYAGNPYRVVTYAGNKQCSPYKMPPLPFTVGLALRQRHFVGLSLWWPYTDGNEGDSGHAITAWGDDGSSDLVAFPSNVRVTDSDTEPGWNGDAVEVRNYDAFTNPNPGGINNGLGWYIDYPNSRNHPFIRGVVTLKPVWWLTVGFMDIRVVTGSIRLRQAYYPASATDFGYTVVSPRNILSYRTSNDWDPDAEVEILENDRPATELRVNWDFKVGMYPPWNVLPYGEQISATAEVAMQLAGPITFKDIRFAQGVRDTTLPPGLYAGWRLASFQASEPIPRDASGGYIVGRFLVYPDAAKAYGDTVEYRLQHEYEYDEIPGLHFFQMATGAGIPAAEPAWVDSIRFGHSYGLLQDDELWTFDDWLTTVPAQQLSPGDSLSAWIDFSSMIPPPRSTNYIRADFDLDGLVDLPDYDEFAACFSGQGIPADDLCTWADLDSDGDVDCHDWFIFEESWTGPPTEPPALPGCPESRWEDATTLATGHTGAGTAVAWGDYDDDGDPDLYVANYYEQANALFMNNGGSLVYVMGSPVNDAGSTAGGIWGDYDNDGLLDLYIANNGANKLFHNAGSNQFTDVTTYPLDNASDSAHAAWADFDNDGRLDLYISNSGAANLLLRQTAEGNFADVTASPINDTGTGRTCAWGDYDNDGDPDLYLAKLGQPNRLYENIGNGAFAETATGPFANPGHSVGAIWGDIDNDGDLDLYVTNVNEANSLYRNEGGGVFIDHTFGDVGNDESGQGAAFGDVDNDGDLDLYLANYSHRNYLFINNGYGLFVDASTPDLADAGNSRGAAFADYDLDGDLDLYVANQGENKLYRNNIDGQHHWLHIDLVGTTSNAAAIGARVRAVAGDLRQIREVSGGSGIWSQNSLTVEFGLGRRSVVDTLEVAWPYDDGGKSRPTVVFTNIRADRRMTIQDPDQASDVPEALQVSALHDCFPNPFNPSTTIRFDIAQRGPVKLAVYDITGRLVRLLVNESDLQADSYSRVWDGRDSAGQQVATGVYLYRLQAGHHSETKRMVLMK